MRSLRSRCATLALLAATIVSAGAQQLPGTISGGVSKINTQALLRQMNLGGNSLILIAAHRGFWRDYPENSSDALRAAYNAGIEAVEIDVRTTSDGTLAVSHDYLLQRETTGTGDLSATSWSTISGLKLRDRSGNPTSYTMLQFSDVLNILSSYQSGGYGPIVIVDMKDKDPWPAYTNALGQLANFNSGVQAAVIFKMKMKNIGDVSRVESEASGHPSYGHIIPVINPEDATGNVNGNDGPDWDNTTGSGSWTPSSSNFQRLYALSKASSDFVQQFELNAVQIGDGSSQYVGPIKTFATYYQPSFYPGGVTNSDGSCCYQAIPLASDLRGVPSFSLFYNLSVTPGVSLITTDKLNEMLNFLSFAGFRNFSSIQ